MTTLRIYGDSFGASTPDGPRDWPALLSKKLAIPLVNKAVHGGSTEYAALQFVKDVQSCTIGDTDIIIYIPSTKGRLHFDFQISQRPETASRYCNGPDNRPGIDNTWYNRSKNHIEWWMANWSDPILSMNFESYVHLISNVARSKPNATFLVLTHIAWGCDLPGVPHPANFFIPPIQFTKITTDEIIGGYEYQNFVQYTKYDPRSNHLTVPNLCILSDLIYETISTKSIENFTMDKFKTNLIKKITSEEQYLEYVEQGYLDYSRFIMYNLRNP
jgi:hypothetical protein